MAKRILNNIKIIRKEKELSLRKLANKISISKTEINDIEKGKKIPNQITMCLISRGLGKPVQEVFNLELKDTDIKEYLYYNQ